MKKFRTIFTQLNNQYIETRDEFTYNNPVLWKAFGYILVACVVALEVAIIVAIS